MEIKVRVCNECQSLDRPTQQYELKSQGKNVKVDLCQQDAAPFEKYLKDAKPRGRAAAKKATKKTTTSRGRRSRVTSMEEIEALKK